MWDREKVRKRCLRCVVDCLRGGSESESEESKVGLFSTLAAEAVVETVVLVVVIVVGVGVVVTGASMLLELL